MNKYKFIGDYKPSSLLDDKRQSEFHDIIRLSKYLWFVDKSAKSRFVVLNFTCYIKTKIDSMEFEIREFNQQNKYIKKSVYTVADLGLPQRNQIVLPNKFSVSDACTSIYVVVNNLVTQADIIESDDKIDVAHTTDKQSQIVRIKDNEFKLPIVVSLILIVLFILIIISLYMIENL